MGCTHINYKREPFVAYYPTTVENCPDFHARVISLKRFRLFSQKIVPISPVRDALQRDMDKGKEFIFENEKKKV